MTVVSLRAKTEEAALADAPPTAPSPDPRPPKAVRADDPSHVIRKGQWIMMGFFGLFMGFAALAPLSSAAVATGEVAVRGNVQTLEAAQGGRVERIHVREGQRVARDQVLIEIENELPQGRLDVLLANWDALKAQEARLIAERSGVPQPAYDGELVRRGSAPATGTVLQNEQYLFERRMEEARLEQEVFEAQMEQLASSETSNLRQARSSETQIALVREELAGVQELRRRGFAPLIRVRALQSRIAGLEQEREDYLQAALQARQKVAETRLSLARAQTGRLNLVSQELADTQLRLTEVAPEVQAARRSVRLTRLRAPAAGQVVGLKVFTLGAVVAEGERLLDVVPAGAPLYIEARVEPGDREDVRAGSQAEVRFTSFSARRDRSIPAVIETVSADSLRDQATGETYYLASLRLDDAAIRDAGLQLTPGIPVQVLVRARSRTLLQYFIEPLTDQLSGAMRED